MTTAEFSKAVKQVRHRIPGALRLDRTYARRRLAYIYSRGAKLPPEKALNILAEVTTRLERSALLKKHRYKDFPPVSINTTLPIAAREKDIIAAVRANPVVIVSGATGSGKTTQIPRMCVAAALGRDGRIGCTQPRRIAAVTIARRISSELGAPVGSPVGYKIRFSDKTGDNTLIKIMTDGILLTEAQHDPLLHEYDVLVIDEAHERSLNIDFLLGLLKTLLQKRADLKVIITSATIDTEKFSAAFNRAPVIEVSGTLFPVTVRYVAPQGKKAPPGGDNAVENYVDQAVKAVDLIVSQETAGDILVFMPTAQDIRETCKIITGRKYKGLAVLSLYAQLPAERQEKVFKKQRGRKIIVATNIAETSLTVPGIRYVVDTGLARIPYYNPRTRVTSLAVRKISQSSALQRQGRCGRVAAGVCVRLYPEKDFLKRHVFTPPEVSRANLAEVILRMMSLNLGDVRQFPFVDPPMEKSIADGFDVLYELGAIKPSGAREQTLRNNPRLTKTGVLMAKIPVDPRLSRILIEAGRSGCLSEALIIAAALSIQDPRETPPDREKEARSALDDFSDPFSDFVTLLNIWAGVKEKEAGALRMFCRDHFLSAARIREWRDIHNQLREIAGEYRMFKSATRCIDRKKDPEKFYEVFHKAILSGYLSNIAEKKEKNLYLGARSRAVSLFPGSSLFNAEAAWIVSAELVETTRLYARTAAVVEREWIREVAGELCRPVYLNPRWARDRGEAVADRQFVLFGLCVGVEAEVPYGPADMRQASDLFIRHALVRGEVDRPLACMRHNSNIIEAVIQVEDRLRRKDFLVTEDERFQFFRDKLDFTVFSMAGLKKHIRKNGDALLRLSQHDVMRREPEREAVALFPEAIKAGKLRLPLVYKFDPTDAADGVTVNIPDRSAPDVSPDAFDWLVPGLLREKVAALLKNLPKEYRKKLVPLNRTVDVVLAEMPRQDRTLIMALSDFISQRFGLDIPGAAWQPERLPEHLRMRLAVVGEDGRVVSASRDSSMLRSLPAMENESDILADIRRAVEKMDIDHRQFPDLTDEIVLPDRRGVVYPGLEKQGRAVGLRIFTNRITARDSNRGGVRGLLEKRLEKEIDYLKKDVALSPKTAGQALYLGGAAALSTGMAEKIMADCLCKNIRTRAEFDQYAAGIAGTLYQRAHDMKEIVEAIVVEYSQARQELAGLLAPLNPGGDVARELTVVVKELAEMLPDNFVTIYDLERLAQIPRYIRAARLRARRLVENFPAHCRKTEQVKWAVDELARLMATLDSNSSGEKRQAVESFFWMVEEYKLSVFAQEQKTAFPVSKKRLQEKIREIDRMV